jgi:hypothetical protein
MEIIISMIISMEHYNFVTQGRGQPASGCYTFAEFLLHYWKSAISVLNPFSVRSIIEINRIILA